MTISFTCTCGKAVVVADEYAGRDGECPSCKRTVRIPAGGEFTEQAPPIVPKRSGSKPAPWDEVRPVEPLPEPVEDDVAELVTHAGKPIAKRDDFFVEAPREIGRLNSAFTTLRTDTEPTAPALRFGLAGVLFVVAFAIAAMLSMVLRQPGHLRADDLLYRIAIPAAIAAIPAAGVLWWTRFKHTCSYVGADGTAIFECSGSRDHVTRSDVFLFTNAIELRISQTRHYYNGVYTGTNYSFTWSDDQGKTVYEFAGRYSSEAGTPGASDPYHFALSAENAWTMHLFRGIERIRGGNELLYFGLRGGDYIQLGQGLFILVQGGKTIELTSDQIEKMTIGDGVISVWQKGAKAGWFVNKGIHQFMYADLGNARFFLFALDALLGIRF